MKKKTRTTENYFGKLLTFFKFLKYNKKTSCKN